MYEEQFIEILNKIQQTSASHQKCLNILTKIYEKAKLNDFVEIFTKMLIVIFKQPIDKKNIYIKRALDFYSKFCADIARKEEHIGNDEDNERESFISAILTQIFPMCDVNYVEVRYHSCLFIMNTLSYIGNDVQLENKLCDQVQEVMLQRLEYDNRLEIRLQAISALVRIQDPSEVHCPVISAYVKCLNDHHPVIRRHVMKVIAICSHTLPIVQEHINDFDPDVCCIAYQRLADVGPLIILINNRLRILSSGLRTDHPKIKKVFYDTLLNKWLANFNNDYLQFLKSLKLSTSEIDLNAMATIGKKILRFFYTTHPLVNLMESLPIENKVIKIDCLNNETILYWYCLIKHFRSDQNLDDYLDNILPELTHFCHYIERIISEKFQPNKKMSDLETAEFEFNLLYLFKIVKNFDFSDEVGRVTAGILVTKILTEYQFNNRKLIAKLIKILLKSNIKVDKFLVNIKEILNEISEPNVSTVVQQELSKYDIMDRKFKVAQFSTRIVILEEEQNDAIKDQQYIKANEIDGQLKKLREEFEILKQQLNPSATTMQTVTVQRTKKTDTRTLCYCLDILISLLKLIEINKLTPILVQLKDDLLLTVINNDNYEIQWRYLECLCLYCLIDKNLAEHYYRDILSPILVYKFGNYPNTKALKIALMGFADLLCLYGTEIIKLEDDSNNNTRKRLLYSHSTSESLNNDTTKLSDSVTFTILLDAILTILDNEVEDVKITTIIVLCKIIQYITLTPNVLCRILLKWFNPVVEQNEEIYTTLGFFVETYIKLVHNAVEVIRESIVPVLVTIIDAPQNSPLKTIRLDTIHEFFTMLMKSEDDVKIRNSILDLIGKISDDSNKKIVHLLAKIVFHLDLAENNVEERVEIINHVESTMNKITDKIAKRYLEKFIAKLKLKLNELPDNTNINANRSDDQPIESTNININVNNENTINNSNNNNNTQNNNDDNNKSNSNDTSIDNVQPSTSSGFLGVSKILENNEPARQSKVENYNIGRVTRSQALSEILENNKPIKQNKVGNSNTERTRSQRLSQISLSGRNNPSMNNEQIQTPLPITNQQTKRKKRNKNTTITEQPSTSGRNVTVTDTSDSDSCNTAKKVPTRRLLRLAKPN